MSLSPSTVLDLRKELEGLNRIRTHAEARIKAIEAILVPFDMGPATLPFSPSEGTNGSGHRPKVRDVADPSFVSTGLRAAILDSLKRRGTGRAADVSKMLVMQGFKNDSPTPLTTRVYNDLWRLSQKGVVDSKDGVFTLKESR